MKLAGALRVAADRIVGLNLPHRGRPHQINRPDEELMKDYRIFRLTSDGNVAGPAIVERCGTDVDAVKAARKHLRSQQLEVWDGSRRVAILPPVGAPSAESRPRE